MVVSGIGLTTGLGGREATWQALRARRSSLRCLDGRFAAFPFPVYGSPVFEERGKLAAEPLHQLVDAVAREAVADAGLSDRCRADRLQGVAPDRVAVLIGTSKGGIGSLSRLARGDAGPEASRLWQAFWPSSCASRVAAAWGLSGPCLAPVAACATGLVAVLQAAELIRRGACDVALAGAVDAGIEPILLGSFHAMKALARVGDDPARAVRPWDRRRSGFLVGEGGAVLVLESADQAQGRGARIYAEVLGGAIGADACHLTNLGDDPATLARLITTALARAGAAPERVDHVNVHGTATRANDPLECRAIRLALGPRADHVACSANKAQIGHMLGAAGAAELAITCLAIRDGVVPPIVNLDKRDEACDLIAFPESRPWPIDVALKLSLGFGGHLAVGVLGRATDETPVRRSGLVD